MFNDMSTLNLIALFLASIGIVIGLFFGCYFLVAKKLTSSVVFLAFYLFAYSLFFAEAIYFTLFNNSLIYRYFFFGLPLIAASSLFLYCKENSNLSIKTLGFSFGPFILYSIVVLFYPFTIDYAPELLYVILLVTALILGIIPLVTALKTTPNNLPLQKKQWITQLCIANLILVMYHFLLFTGFISYLLGGAILFSVFVFLFGSWAIKNPGIFLVSKEKYSQSNLNKDASDFWMQKIQLQMEIKKWHLNPEANLGLLAKEIGLSSKEVSQIINESQNLNYSQYITKHRINEAKKLLLKPENANCKIIAIAYDSGFNSISSFNAAFKKSTGKTASEYRYNFSKP